VFPSRGRWLSARAFEYELTALLVAGMPLSTHQSGSMLGVSGFSRRTIRRAGAEGATRAVDERSAADYEKPQCSACFINSVRTETISSAADVAVVEGNVSELGIK
jgi:hypothetical protein